MLFYKKHRLFDEKVNLIIVIELKEQLNQLTYLPLARMPFPMYFAHFVMVIG